MSQGGVEVVATVGVEVVATRNLEAAATPQSRTTQEWWPNYRPHTLLGTTSTGSPAPLTLRGLP